MSIKELFFHKVRSAGLTSRYVSRHKPPALVLIQKNGKKKEYYWQDYQEKALQAMAGLQGRNLKAGDFVAIVALNLPESFFIMLGAILMDVVPVPINAMLLKETEHGELKKILEDCKPGLVLSNGCLKKLLPEFCLPIEQILAEGASRVKNQRTEPETKEISWLTSEEKKLQRPLIMPYTSGTSGQPKGVMLSETAIMDRVAAITKEVETAASDKLLSYLSLGHISELVATFFGQIHGGYTVYFTEQIEELVKDRKKFIKIFPEILRQVQPTIFLAVPKIWMNFQLKIEELNKKIPVFVWDIFFAKKIFIKIIKWYLGFAKTRIFVSAGSNIEQTTIDFFKQLNIRINDIYGQTETGGPILIDGLPIDNVAVTVSDWIGEIVIKGSCLMIGYYHNQAATAEKIREMVVIGGKERTYFTGDAGILGKKLARRRFCSYWPIHCVGRLDDGFKLANGEFIATPKLYELENKIKKIDGIEEAIICGKGKPFLIALVFVKENCNKDPEKTVIRKNVQHLIDRAGEGLYKIKNFWLLGKDDLELTPTMKVKRKAIIEKFKNIIDAMTDTI